MQNNTILTATPAVPHTFGGGPSRAPETIWSNLLALPQQFTTPTLAAKLELFTRPPTTPGATKIRSTPGLCGVLFMSMLVMQRLVRHTFTF